jgi:hypothetical protein
MSNGLGFMRSRAGVAVVAVVMAIGCADGPQAVLVPGEALLAKGGGGGGGPSVSATTPSYGHQGDLGEQVTITGSGFAVGAVAAWERNGVPDPRITVLSTQFISSTQLVATINIAPDAEISLYDVSVTNTDRKKGIGTAMFEVTTAELIGTLGTGSMPYDVSDDGSIAGYCTGCTGAFVYESGFGLVDLGAWQAWANDPLGTMVFGRDAESFPVAWVRLGPGSYVAEALPILSYVGGNASTAARNASGTLIAAGWVGVQVSKNNRVQRPAVWTRVGSSWSNPVIYAYPGTKAAIYDINGNGQAVGRWDASKGVVWDSPTSYATLNGIPDAINGAGTVVVGSANGQPVYWVRNPSTQAWNSTGIPLPHVSGSSCSAPIARDVNDGGIIVGSSCNQSARVATVWRLDMSGATPVLSGGATGLPGLGVKGSDKSGAVAVSTTAPFFVAGRAAPSGQDLVVRWVLP